VDSAPGRGSTFAFTARFGSQPHPAETAPAPPPVLLRGLRVLVVDDNATNRQILRHQIVAWKMQKGSAAGGHEALKILRAAANSGKPYDVALLDMQMPEMDGLTLARAIKADPLIASTHLIILTSLGHVITQKELKDIGIAAYLVKPVKQSRLFDCLIDVVGQAMADNIFVKAVTPVAISTGAPSKIRILLAEDNAVNQKVALAQFKKLGYDAQAVTNGLEAMQALDVAGADDSQAWDAGVGAESGNLFLDGHAREQVRNTLLDGEIGILEGVLGLRRRGNCDSQGYKNQKCKAHSDVSRDPGLNKTI